MKQILLALLLLCGAVPAQAAIAVDSSADLGTGNTSGLSASFTNTAGTVVIAIVKGEGVTSNVDPYSGATYAGAAMTRIAVNIGATSTNNFYKTAIYCKASAATGANTLAVTGTFNTSVAVHAVSITGSNGCTTDGVQDIDGSACCGATVTFHVTTAVANSWVFVAAFGQFAQPIAGSGITNTHFATNSLFSGNSGVLASTGSHTFVVGNSANAYELCAVAIQVAAAASSCPQTLSLLGVGC